MRDAIESGAATLIGALGLSSGTTPAIVEAVEITPDLVAHNCLTYIFSEKTADHTAVAAEKTQRRSTLPVN
jgi:hypothetical protein